MQSIQPQHKKIYGIAFASCFLVSLLLQGSLLAQSHKRRSLTTEEQQRDVLEIYSYNATDHYAVITITLFNDGRFEKSMSTFNQDLSCEGRWQKKNDTLFLTNKLPVYELDIALEYAQDTVGLLGDLNVAIPVNLKREPLVDGLVMINNEKIKCSPLYGICDEDYTRIDSIRVFFENGMKTRWVKVDQLKPFKKIIPVVQVSILTQHYWSSGTDKYLIKGEQLEWIRP